MATEYIDPEIATDGDEIHRDAVDWMRGALPGWKDDPAAPEVLASRAQAHQHARGRDLILRVFRSIFRTHGIEQLRIDPLEGERATVAATITARDTAGYTLPIGIQFDIGGFVFSSANEVTIPNGQDETDPGEVVLQAPDVGDAYNDLGADGAQLLDTLRWVALDGVALTGVTGGGENAEGLEEYLDRLAQLTEIVRPTVVEPRNAATVAGNVAGVGRAWALRYAPPANYAPTGELSVFVHDDDGDDCSTPVVERVQDELDAKREEGFVFHVLPFTRTTIDAHVRFKASAGADTAALETAVVAAVTTHLLPDNYGRIEGSENPTSYEPVDQLRAYDVADVAGDVPLVRSIVGVELAEAGDPLVAGANVPLAGPAPLTVPGTITAEAV